VAAVVAEKLDISMPPDVDLTQGFTLRVTAVDASGALVAGVKVGTVVITANVLGTGSLESGTFGPFMLVPGPGA
jgi:hypothetical protein